MRHRTVFILLVTATVALTTPQLASAKEKVVSQRTADGGTILYVQPTGPQVIGHRSYMAGAGSDSPATMASSRWHWGYFHAVKRYTRKRTEVNIDSLYIATDGLLVATAILGIRAPPYAVITAITAIGYGRLARSLDRALAKARKEPAIRLDAGFRCYDIPGPDPCYPKIQIRPRR